MAQYDGYLFPYINLGVDLDVTNLYLFSKKHKISFYCAMMYASVMVASRIENFRYRMVDGKPMLAEKLHPVFTHIPPGEEDFILIEGIFEENIDLLTFCHNTQKKMEAKDEWDHLGEAGNAMEIIHVTCIPWVKYNHFIRTVKGSGDDSIPRFSWGKYVEDTHSERVIIPFSVQVHHGLMDGYHVGLFFEQLQLYLDELPV